MTTDKIFTRDFVLCFFCQFLFSFAFSALGPTLPIYLQKLGLMAEEIGLLVGIFSIPSMILRPFVARLLQRIPEKKFMIGGVVISALTTLAFIWVPPFWPFLFLRMLQGVGFAFFYTAVSILATGISPGMRLGQTIGYFYLSMNIPFALAPSLGIVVMNHFGFNVLFEVCTALYICCLLLIIQLGRRQDAPEKELPGQMEFALRPEGLHPCVLNVFTHMIWGALTTFLPLFALNHGVANPGVLFSALAGMLILGRALGGRLLDLYKRERVILPCLILYIFVMTLLVFSKNFPMLMLMSILWGTAHSLLYPSVMALAIERSGSSRGLILAVFTAAGELGVGLGPMIMGVVIQWTDFQVMFGAVVLIAVINLSYFYFFILRGRVPQK
jgi:MFS family permease